MSAPDKPNNLMLFGSLMCGVVLLVGMVAGVMQLFRVTVEGEIQRKVLAPQGQQVRSLRAEEETKLNSYQWVDQKNGVVRIPVREAVELTLREWKDRPTTPVP